MTDQHEDVALFLRLDRIAAGLSMIFVIGVNALLFRESGVWLALPLLAMLNLALYAAERALTARLLFTALVLIASGNWAIAVGIPLLFPFLWPVMTLTVMMPLVVASPHLTRRQIVAAIVTAAAICATVASIGLLNDDGGVIDDIDDTIELIVVVGCLSVQIVPIGLVVWQHNEMQRTNVGSLRALNADLLTSEAALAASRNRVVQASDTERRRIERDLHDGAQQRLVAMGVRLRLLQSQGHEDPLVQDGITTLISELDGAIEEVRELAHGIYPPLLQTRGLPDALSVVARRSGLDVTTSVVDIDRLPEPVETALYFTALEALTNATKHAAESSIELTLATVEGDVVLTVADYGIGFDPSTTATSHGFDNMRDRLAVVGGSLVVESSVGHGTTVTATVPRRS